MNSWQAKFSSAERAVLNSVRELLSEAGRSRLDSQLIQINKIIRLLDDTEVNLYIQHWLKNQQPKTESLFLRSGDFRLAKMELTDARGNTSLRATVYATGQIVFSIQFTHPPKKLGENILVKKAELLHEPMDTTESTNNAPIAILPEDFFDVKGSIINGWKIFQREEIYSVTFEGLELFLIAEKEDHGWIASAMDDEEAGIQFFFVSIDDCERRTVGRSLRQACDEN